jgi:hypothetical protein
MRLTWQIPAGHDAGVQLVGVLQPHQSFGRTHLVVVVGEVLPLDGQVGDEPCSTNKQSEQKQQWL